MTIQAQKEPGMQSMIPKFFGQYLLEKEILDKDQLIEAINYQKSKILKLGEIAIKHEFLSEKQVAKIHNEQKRTDMRFGDLSVSMGFLTPEQLEEIITIQKNNHIYLGEAIVACGHLDKDSLDLQLKAFKDEQQSVPPIEIMIKEDIPHKDLVEVSVDLTEKLFRRIGDMISKSGQLRIDTGSTPNLGVASSLDFRGDINARYIINVTWDIGHEIAKKTFKKEDLPFDEELIKDTLSEFVNIVCGNIRSKMIELGKKLEFQPPLTYIDKVDQSIPVPRGEQAIVVPGYTQIGNYELAIVTKV
jgi:CheY-specific phosphatase CheX